MAEIKIEKKKPVWPWIVAGIILVALIIFYFANDDDDQSVRNAEQETEVSDTNEMDNTAVVAYVQFVDAEQGRMGEDHEYTQQALQKLTEAVRELADEKGYDISADLDQAEQAANEITNDASETDHAEHIRNAADALTRAITNMQQEYYPDLQDNAQELMNTTESIDPAQLTLEQKEAVKSFFDQSAELIEEMD